jgi:thiazole synthase ThiGH ThiG subunit
MAAWPCSSGPAAAFITAGAVAVGAGTSLARAADPQAAARALVQAVRPG